MNRSEFKEGDEVVWFLRARGDFNPHAKVDSYRFERTVNFSARVKVVSKKGEWQKRVSRYSVRTEPKHTGIEIEIIEPAPWDDREAGERLVLPTASELVMHWEDFEPLVREGKEAIAKRQEAEENARQRLQELEDRAHQLGFDEVFWDGDTEEDVNSFYMNPATFRKMLDLADAQLSVLMTERADDDDG